MATASYLTSLNQILNRITLYVPYCTIIFGVSGAILNIFTFTSKQLRENPCGLCFLFSSIFDLFYLGFSTTTRLLGDHYAHMIPSSSSIFCKLRTYVSVLFPTLATWFLVWSSIDRCLSTSTSNKWRKLSSRRIIYLMVFFSTIFFILCYLHMLIFYNVQLRNPQTLTYICVPPTGFYATFLSSLFLTINGGFYLIMFIACLVTLKHVRTSRHRVATQTNMTRTRFPSVDRHLITIMLFQIGFGFILCSFRVFVLAYSLLTGTVSKSVERLTIESIIEQLSLVIYYINFAKSFPVNMVTSPLFRRIFIQRTMNLWKTSELIESYQ